MSSTLTSPKRGAKSPRPKPAGSPARLRPQNRKLLHWIETWLESADDRDEAWWSDLEASLRSHRLDFRPTRTG